MRVKVVKMLRASYMDKYIHLGFVTENEEMYLEVKLTDKSSSDFRAQYNTFLIWIEQLFNYNQVIELNDILDNFLTFKRKGR